MSSGNAPAQRARGASQIAPNDPSHSTSSRAQLRALAEVQRRPLLAAQRQSLTSAQLRALTVARHLIEHGVPIFLAEPVLDHEGRWVPTGGVGGYRLPSAWQRTEPDVTVLDRWRPGFALCMVTGHGVDVLDVDPRSGGAESYRDMKAAGAVPCLYGQAASPSAGGHGLMRSLGIRSRDGFMPGLDLKAGVDGHGHGFVFIAPTVRLSKVTGELVPYTWQVEPDLDALDPDDDTGAALAARVAAVRSGTMTTGSAPVAYVGPTYADLTPSRRARVDGHDAALLVGLRSAAADLAALPEGARASTLGMDPAGRPWRTYDPPVGWEAQRGLADLVVYALRRDSTPWLGNDGAGVAALWEASTDPAWRALVEAKLRSQAKYAAERGPLDVPGWWSDEDGANIVTAALGAAAASPVVAGVEGVVVDPEAIELGMAAHFSHSSLAERFAAYYEGRLIHVERRGWLVYVGAAGVWTAIPDKIAAEYVRKWLRSEAKRAIDGLQDAGRIVSTLTRRSTVTDVLTLARGIPALCVEDDQLDADPDLVNTPSGVVHVPTGEVREHDARFLMTRTTRVPYVPGARHPDWDRVLKALRSDAGHWLQRRMGQALTGHPPSDDVVLILQGGGSNAKTTMVEAIVNTIGDYAVKLSETALTAKPGAHPHALMPLRGARLALSEELDDGGVLNMKRIKDATGQQTMKARGMYESDAQWRVSHSLIVTSNYRPKVSETDDGTWRRLLLVVFPYRYRKAHEALETSYDRPADPDLRGRMRSGAEGQHEAVLAWLIEGGAQWYAQGDATVPDSVAQDTAAWRGASDPLRTFLATSVEFDPNGRCLAGDLLLAYNSWAQDTGRPTVSDAELAARLADHPLAATHGIVKRRTTAAQGITRWAGGGDFLAQTGGKPNVWFGIRFPDSDPLTSKNA